MKLVYTVIVALLLFMPGCSEEIPLNSGGKGPVVYLAVTRAHVADTESINKDNTDFEDRVHDLAMLVFDSNTGNLIANHFDEHIPKDDIAKSFTVELTPGLRDFYFIANRPKSEISGITTRAVMNTYMSGLRNLDDALYTSATENKGFPMSRIYTNQQVTAGGTIYQPVPFRPHINNVSEERVKLIRAVAKLEIDLRAIATDVSSVRYYHANRNFNLKSPASTSGDSPFYTTPGFDYVTLTGKQGVFLFYMPELIMPQNVVWDEAKASTPINYFEIVFFNNKSYKIPVITNGESIPDYLDFVKTGTPDFNILRNDHYKYTIRRSGNGIEILYSILPWSRVKKELYMGYWFNIETGDDGSIRIINTVDDCLPHKVTLKALNGAYFGTNPSDKEITYGYETEIDPAAGSEKMKEGYFEDYKINNEPVASGAEYMEVYYNDLKVKTYLK